MAKTSKKDKDRSRESDEQASAEPVEAPKQKVIRMNATDYLIGVGFTVTLGLIFAFYSSHPRIAIWSGFVCWCFVGAGLAVILTRQFSATTQPLAEPHPVAIKAAFDDRPWLVVQTVTFAHLLEVGPQVSVQIDVANTGKSLALNALAITQIAWMTIDYAVFDPSKPMPDATLPDSPSRAVVGPGVRFAAGVALQEKNTPDRIKAFQSGALGMYVFGFIDYDDATGKSWHTRYCFQADPLDNRTVKVCPFWNDAGEGRLWKPEQKNKK